MNALSTGAAPFIARAEGLRGRLPGGPALDALREEGLALLRAEGLPSRRVEAWRYTDLGALARAGFTEALTEALEHPALPAPRAAHRAVFVDGRLAPHLSALPAGAATLAAAPEAAAPLLSAAQGQFMAALNAALCEDGLVLDVPPGADWGTVELLSLAAHAGRPIAFHPRHAIRLGAGARLTLLETSLGPDSASYLHNPVFDVAVAEGATLTHVRVQREGRGAFHLACVRAAVAAGGTYDSFTLNVGGRLARAEMHVALRGPKAAAHLNGAQLAKDGQHAEITTFLDHAAPDCPSRQTVKTVLHGRARGVFQGKILVRQAAQRTDGYQMNQALLLSEDAEIDAKPQLEIYADDVKCSHGATVGALDPDHLFYLRARGVPEAEARSLLIQAFLQEAIEGVTDEAAAAALAEATEGWWA